MKKILCLLLTFCVVLSMQTVFVSADEVDTIVLDPILATENYYIRQDNKDIDYSVTKHNTNIFTRQRNKASDSEGWLQFDLSTISIPSGYEIGSAKIKLYATRVEYSKSYKFSANLQVFAIDNYTVPTTKSFSSVYKVSDEIDATANSSIIGRFETVDLDYKTVHSSYTISDKTEGATEFTDQWVDIDVTDHLNSVTSLSNETFVIIPEEGTELDVYFYSSHQDPEYTPKLEVTLKEITGEPLLPSDLVTVKAVADTKIRQAGGQNSGDALNNFGSDPTLRANERGHSLNDEEVWIKFDLSDVVPDGYEIESAKVRLYVTTAEYNPAYIAENGNVSAYLYSIADEWNEDELTFASAYPSHVADTAPFILRRTGEIQVGKIAITGQDTGSAFNVNDWIEFDVSKYFESKTSLDKESFVFIPQNANENVTIYSKEYDDGIYAPQLVIKYKEKEPVIEINKPTDYDYSFAVVGDVDVLTASHPEYLTNIYDWLIDNADQDKLKFVFGVGDVASEDVAGPLGLYKALTEKLDDVVPYSVVRGDNDTVKRFNTFFPYDSSLTRISGTYDATLLNTYKFLTVNGIKYLIFTIDYGATDEVLEWAGNIISENSDCNVIITTHSFLNSDKTMDSNMWDKLIKNYENIVLVLSGHDTSENIVISQDTGVNGNTVTSLLVNPDTVDTSEEGAGLVAMLYFSDGGKKVDVRYYSTVKNMYYLVDNQFSFDIDVAHSDVDTTEHPETVISGLSFDVNLTANQCFGKIIAVLYDEDGSISSIQTYDAANSINVSFPKNAKGSLVKVFWWDGFDSITPVCTYDALSLIK